ncbi:SDR family NAD(P)-dependent oxidoreductase [Paraburkholderia phenoliruptrix]|uniref:Short-chain dehydrogenase/reductase SDR n=2 Tax=Paraburkholderia phenoliruptrix TaxID=252970 RepID=K0DZP0_9BURK|nr:glucose 1-dehydrogenase [Paraburkholderia phenoliruptrix]AFT90375.1 short-chain dehydrogenase/reductase SDR [Paraburkholderia phenoliruptrix BR3459a]CAB4051794.1 Galactitol 2-dehydrogenase [Paraburkholderia phenoliruptrix]
MYLEKFRLDGRRAVVTGGGRGIGLEISKALGEAGASVVIAELDRDTGRTAEDRLRSLGIDATARRIDVTHADAVAELARELNEERVIDILVNNAGIAIVTDFFDTPDDVWTRTMQVNSDAAFWCGREFGRHMAKRGAGCIVNIGSMCGYVVTKPHNPIPYMASKGAMHMTTKAMACALAKTGVRVNAVAPGYVETEMTRPLRDSNPDWLACWEEMTPMGRLAHTHEIASAVLFLASDAASYCTGTILTVDGGYTSW